MPLYYGPHILISFYTMLPVIIRKFLRWYDQYDDFNIVFTAFLFSIQIIHLIWLATNIVLPRLFNIAPLIVSDPFNIIVAVVDYTEIPALISTSLLYFRSFKRKANKKDLFYIFLLNFQWFHILWITDEVVLEIFNPPGFVENWNINLAWIAILVDYLELPVIVETLKRAFKVMSKTS